VITEEVDANRAVMYQYLAGGAYPRYRTFRLLSRGARKSYALLCALPGVICSSASLHRPAKHSTKSSTWAISAACCAHGVSTTFA